MFKAIEGYEGWYEVSSEGEVFSTPKDGKPHRVLKQEVIKRSHTTYRRVSLCREGAVKRFQVHRLVGKAFLQNPENKPCINHIDNNGENNLLDNLEWCTYSENMKHSSNQGRQDGVRKLGGEVTGRKAKTKRNALLETFVGKSFGNRIMLKVISLGNHPKAEFECLICNSHFQGTIDSVLSEVKKGSYLACRSCSLKHAHKNKRR